jgi:hypothetical protein
LPSPTAESSGYGKQVKATSFGQFFWLEKVVLLAVGQEKKKKKGGLIKPEKTLKNLV